jgi:hypothetical protein
MILSYLVALYTFFCSDFADELAESEQREQHPRAACFFFLINIITYNSKTKTNVILCGYPLSKANRYIFKAKK